MAERFINKHRTLVGVDMGKGCLCLDDPSKALAYLMENCDSLGNHLTRSVRRIRRDGSGGANYSTRPYLFRALQLDSGIIEQFETAQLELAWLFGKEELVETILKRR